MSDELKEQWKCPLCDAIAPFSKELVYGKTSLVKCKSCFGRVYYDFIRKYGFINRVPEKGT